MMTSSRRMSACLTLDGRTRWRCSMKTGSWSAACTALRIGGLFAGEAMFHHATDAVKSCIGRTRRLALRDRRCAHRRPVGHPPSCVARRHRDATSRPTSRRLARATSDAKIGYQTKIKKTEGAPGSATHRAFSCFADQPAVRAGRLPPRKICVLKTSYEGERPSRSWELEFHRYVPATANASASAPKGSSISAGLYSVAGVIPECCGGGLKRPLVAHSVATYLPQRGIRADVTSRPVW